MILLSHEIIARTFFLLLLIFVAIYRENEGLTALFTEPVIHKTS